MIGGKVLDASAVAAVARGDLAMGAWLEVARGIGVVLVVPTLAVAEVHAVLPHAAGAVAELLAHPSVLLVDLDAASAAQVDRLLVDAEAFDALAGHVAHEALRRDWPALTNDPQRLRRLSGDVSITAL